MQSFFRFRKLSRRFFLLGLLWSVLTGTSFALTEIPQPTGVWLAKGFSSIRSFGSGGFKSVRSFQLSEPSRNNLSNPSSPVSPYHSTSFFWMPMPGWGPMPAGGGLGWVVLLVLVGGVVIYAISLRRRAVRSPEERTEDEEISVLLAQCEQNLNYLTDKYVEAGSWLERLEGRIPEAEWREYRTKYGQIRVDEFEARLAKIREELQEGRTAAARVLLFAFDDDAVEVFDYFNELEGRLSNKATKIS